MKLNNARTMLVGLAFLSICAFWQLYDATVPLMLRDTFQLGDGWAGAVMALDNVLALLLLPLFGHLSDRTRTRWGRRMPYIFWGTAAAMLLMDVLMVMNERANFPGFMLVLALLLVAMGSYRSPAVALMPDVTPKPLRSRANAIINLMGAVGGILALGIIALNSGDQPNYTRMYVLVLLSMGLSVGALKWRVNEPEIALPMEHGEQARASGGRLPPDVFRSLALILSSVFLWFMGYNAVTTAFTKYATQAWGMDLGDASLCLMVATGGAIAGYLPVGLLSGKIGRKRMILSGVALMALCFVLGALVRQPGALAYALFALIGLSWAAINVNSYPMVVELSTGADVGKYTGYYYTFSMAAQIITPILSGLLLSTWATSRCSPTRPSWWRCRFSR